MTLVMSIPLFFLGCAVIVWLLLPTPYWVIWLSHNRSVNYLHWTDEPAGASTTLVLPCKQANSVVLSIFVCQEILKLVFHWDWGYNFNHLILFLRLLQLAHRMQNKNACSGLEGQEQPHLCNSKQLRQACYNAEKQNECLVF